MKLRNHTILVPEPDKKKWERAAEVVGMSRSDFARYWLNHAANGRFRPVLVARQHNLGRVPPSEETMQFQFRVSPDELNAWTDAANGSPCVHIKVGAKRANSRDRSEWERQVLSAAAEQILLAAQCA